MSHRVQTPFSRTSTASEVIDGVDLSGRTAIITRGGLRPRHLAASPLLDNVGGRYFEDCNEAAVVNRRPDDYAGVAWYALDQANAERLWDTALGLLSAKAPA
jgi:hypothetical protein